MKQKSILVLACGLNSAYHMIKVLKNNYTKEFRIIGADINEPYLVPSINLVDKFYKVSPSKIDGFYKEIISILDKEKIDIIIPIFDLDQKLFYKDNPDLLNRKIISTAPIKKTFEYYGNKEKLNNFLTKNHISTPKIYSIKEIKTENEYFLKPKDGVGSIDAKKATGKEILNCKEIENYVIQEVCHSPELTVEAFFFQNKISTVTRERLETKAGVCTKTCIYHNQKLENIVKKFTKVITVPIIFNLQFMKNQKNKFVVIDVNLRLAGGMGLSYKAGWDEVSAISDMWLNKSETEIFSHLKLNSKKQWITRVYEEIITKTN